MNIRFGGGGRGIHEYSFLGQGEGGLHEHPFLGRGVGAS